jgi:GNAT superfamily N-acetyltransferase
MTVSSSRINANRYAGKPDLRAMQHLSSRIWSPASRWHAGDLAWGRFQHAGREPEYPTMLWRAGDRTVAWGWIELPDHLSLTVDPEHAHLASEVLTWFAETAPGAARTVTVSDAELHLVSALAHHGYRQANDGPFFIQMTHDLDRLPEPVVPPGYRLRTVADEDVRRRVTAHRAAFHPSRVTEESYRSVRDAWPYQAGLDWFAEPESADPETDPKAEGGSAGGPEAGSAGGSAAAFCLVWLDDTNGAALIEPVGTQPSHRGRGLARAVCLAALRAARDAGATRAVVCPRGDDAYPIPARLYRGLGFRDVARTHTFHSA